VFALLTLVYVVTAPLTSPRSYNVDTAAASIGAQAIAHYGTHDVSVFEDDGGIRWIIDTDSGRYSDRAPGIIYSAVPAYSVDRWINGQSSTLRLAPGSLTAIAFTAAACALITQVVYRRLDYGASVATGLILGLATPTWPISGLELWPHGLSQFWLAVGMLTATSATSATRWVGGFAAAANVLVRPVTAVLIGVRSLFELRSRSERQRGLTRVAGLIAGVAALALYHWLLFDEATIAVSAGAFAENASGLNPQTYLVRVAMALFSPISGILVITPFVGMAAWAALRGRHEAPSDWLQWAIAGAVYLMGHLALNRANPILFFTYRYPLETLTVCAPLAAHAYRSVIAPSKRARWFWWSLVLLSMVSQVIAVGGLNDDLATYLIEKLPPIPNP
jgi:hypothetical protein